MGKQTTICFLQDRIRHVQRERQMTVEQLAEQMSCDRSTVYNMLHRKNINTALLYQLSTVLEHDFFADLSAFWSREMRREE